MEDKKITCIYAGCDTEFLHSVKDQEFYAGKNYVDPKYCKVHREQRKMEKLARDGVKVFNPVIDKQNLDDYFDKQS